MAASHSPAAAAVPVPYQWIAKQYSEALGRAPDAGGWKATVDWFAANGCNQTNLKSQGRGFLTTSEFLMMRAYNEPQKVFVAYRAILSREPDQAGFDNYVGCLTAGTCLWTDVINGLYDSLEFGGLVGSICGLSSSNYRDDLGANRPIPIGGERTQATLQAQLNAGGTVSLNPQEVVYLTSQLTIPASATLVTAVVGERLQTAKMGRLVRDRAFAGSLVKTDGTIDRVWIDG
jgi:hypothetical protein